MAVRRSILTVVAGLFLLALAGATYQGVATALERHRFPRPGGLVDAGGHQLHIYCVGAGAPTVVLEAQAGGMSAAWGWVQPRVAEVTRTCSYDRSGLGWSERGDSHYEPGSAAAELRALLDHAGEAAPFVVAGDGLGAAYAKLFAASFSDLTAALVLVDAPFDDAGSTPGGTSGINRLTPWLARIGILRATRSLSSRAAGLPSPADGTLRAFLNRPDHLTRAAAEASQWNTVVALAERATPNARIPVTRIETRRDPGAFLTSEAEAAPVVTAIVAAATRARSSR